MTATMNTGAETIRVDRKYLPLLMQLKTAGAVGVNAETNEALQHLEAADLVRDGELHPMADAIFELVAEPGLVLSVERMRIGSVAASTIWARPVGAVIGSRVENGVFELKLAAAALLPFHIFQLIHLRPLPKAPQFACTLGAETMLTVESHINEGDTSSATALLDQSGVAAPSLVAAALAARVASWRVHSMWSTNGDPQTAEASGMDCGPSGNVLVTVGADEPTMTLRSASFSEMLSAVRATLPRNA